MSKSKNSIPILTFSDDSQWPLLHDGQHTIGRADCDIIIDADGILPRHAVMVSAGTRVMIKPENQAPITVNGQAIESMVVLNEGDEVHLVGSISFRLEISMRTAVPETSFPKRSTEDNPFDFGEPLFSSEQEDKPSQPVQSSDDNAVDTQLEEDEKQPYTESEREGNGRESVETSGGLTDDEEPLEAISRGDGAAGEVEQVGFTAYYPREYPADKRGSIIVYAHLQNAVVDISLDVERFKEDLGGIVPRPRNAKQWTEITPGTPVTIQIECESLDFDPPLLTRKWDDEWVRFHFDFKIPSTLIDEQILFHVSILVHSIEVARIPNCVMEIIDEKVDSEEVHIGDSNPLANARIVHNDATLYHRIFVSYSRRDTVIVEAYRFAQQALGNDVFMDTYSIRTGENWQVALAKAIENADIFQLFWSEESAKSKNVRDEWEYALKSRCTDDDCSGFIRPVFWVNPLPVTPPEQLKHLHFRYVPLEEE